MPELPEVETVANGVNERVRGQVIASAWFSSKPEPFRSPAELMANHLPGRRIERVRRVGKHIVVDLGVVDPGVADLGAPHAGAAGGGKKGGRAPKRGVASEAVLAGVQEPDAQLLVHLGMTGRLLVSPAGTPVPPHTHAVLVLSSGSELRFVDARRFGRLELLLRPAKRGAVEAVDESAAKRGQRDGAAKKRDGPVGRGAGEETGSSGFGFLGPGTEPLTITPDEFVALFKGRRLAIKSALLNQKLLHGVGNIYADESLFRAGIRPRRMAGRLTRAEMLRLRVALIEVLRAAIALGGSSVSDYVDAEGVAGFFQLEHRVYQRTGQPCLSCGKAIRRIVLSGRSTHYCATCQK